MDKIKEIGGQMIDKAKTWYLGKWKSHKQIMIIVHIFLAVVILGELLK